MQIIDIARVCHEANRAYCQTIGEPSPPSWDEAPEWQRQGVISGVEFYLKNPDAGPHGSHENWLRDKVRDGWIYGPVKDPDKKQHPCMVSYSELPENQRLKDSIFVAIVHTLKDSLAQETVDA